MLFVHFIFILQLLVMALEQFRRERPYLYHSRGLTDEKFNQAIRCYFCVHHLLYYPAVEAGKPLTEQLCNFDVDLVIELKNHTRLKAYLKPLTLEIILELLCPTTPRHVHRSLADRLSFPIASKEWKEANRASERPDAEVIIQEIKEHADDNDGTLPHYATSLGLALKALLTRVKKTLCELYDRPTVCTDASLNIEEVEQLISIAAVAQRLQKRKLLVLCKAAINGEEVSDEMLEALTITVEERNFANFKEQLDELKQATEAGRELADKDQKLLYHLRSGVLALLRGEEVTLKRYGVHSINHLYVLERLPQIQAWIARIGLGPLIVRYKNGEVITKEMLDEVLQRIPQYHGSAANGDFGNRWFDQFESFAALSELPAAKEDGFWEGSKLGLRAFLLRDGVGNHTKLTNERIEMLAEEELVEEWMEERGLWEIWLCRKEDDAYVATAAQVAKVNANAENATYTAKRDKETVEWEEKLEIAIATPPIAGVKVKTAAGKEYVLDNWIATNRKSFKNFILDNESAIGVKLSEKAIVERLIRGRVKLHRWPDFKKWAVALKLDVLFIKRENGGEVTDEERKEVMALTEKFRVANRIETLKKNKEAGAGGEASGSGSSKRVKK